MSAGREGRMSPMPKMRTYDSASSSSDGTFHTRTDDEAGSPGRPRTASAENSTAAPITVSTRTKTQTPRRVDIVPTSLARATESEESTHVEREVKAARVLGGIGVPLE